MKTTCKQPGCDREHAAKGFCNMHYLRHRTGADLDAPHKDDISDEDRFLTKLEQNLSNSCMEYTGCLDRGGYGRVGVGGKDLFAHRYAYELWVGPIPDGLQVRHVTCNNPRCCNPSHLLPGTHPENMADMTAANRQSKGETHGTAKLTELEVREIRKRYAAGGVTHRQLGELYGVHHTVVGRIVRRKHWSHI